MYYQDSSVWTPLLIIRACACVIQFSILGHEMYQRYSSTVQFSNKYLQYISVFCIISGCIEIFARTLVPFDIACIFVEFVAEIFTSLQAALMGFYQLSRLYFCFANTKAYADNGYSKWIFKVMIMIGVTGTMIYSVTAAVHLNNTCGINKDGNVYWKQMIPPDVYTVNGTCLVCLIGISISFIFVCWDITTLLLYVFKIRSFRRYAQSQPDVYQRIISTLSKIVILTLFYQIGVGIHIANMITYSPSNARFIAYKITHLNMVICITLSMYLMMNHNSKQYLGFLKIIYGLKLNYVCCCCAKIVPAEIKATEKALELHIKTANLPRQNTKTQTTQTHTKTEVAMSQVIAK